MTDEEFLSWYGPWTPPTVEQLADLLAAMPAPWWIVGGHAIELFTGAVRPHADIDVAVFRRSAPQLLDALRPTHQCWANSSGSLTPMVDGRVELPPHAQQVWVRRDAGSPWAIDVVIAEERDGRWAWRHDPSVTMTLDELTWIRDDGLRVSRPEVVLAHKARWRQAKDDADFAAAWPMLDDPSRTWLREIVGARHPDHPWLPRMR